MTVSRGRATGRTGPPGPTSQHPRCRSAAPERARSSRGPRLEPVQLGRRGPTAADPRSPPAGSGPGGSPALGAPGPASAGRALLLVEPGDGLRARKGSSSSGNRGQVVGGSGEYPVEGAMRALSVPTEVARAARSGVERGGGGDPAAFLGDQRPDRVVGGFDDERLQPCAVGGVEGRSGRTSTRPRRRGARRPVGGGGGGAGTGGGERDRRGGPGRCHVGQPVEGDDLRPRRAVGARRRAGRGERECPFPLTDDPASTPLLWCMARMRARLGTEHGCARGPWRRGRVVGQLLKRRRGEDLAGG